MAASWTQASKYRQHKAKVAQMWKSPKGQARLGELEAERQERAQYAPVSVQRGR